MPSREEIDEFVDSHFLDQEILVADGYEDAFVGIAVQFNATFAVYDIVRCHAILMERDGMTAEEADEWLSFNVVGAYVGEATPAFIQFIDRKDTP